MVRAGSAQDLAYGRVPPRVWGSAASQRLDPSELQHLKTLRWRPGQITWLLDGVGGCFEITPDAAGVFHTAIEQPGPKHKALQLAVALPDRAAFKDVIKSAAMLGAREIHLIYAQRSASHGVRYNEFDLKKAVLWMREVCKQAINPWLPRLNVHESLMHWLDNYTPADLTHWRLYDPRAHAAPVAGTWPLIGPEGGWTDDELRLARDRGLHGVQLATPVLTVATATVAALTIAAQ